MDLGIAGLLAGAGVIGGVMNAVAGGATLITFPAMLAAGLPPIIANASNAVAVSPGNLVAAIADRSQLPAFDRRALVAVATACIGGMVGALLLLATPESLFTRLVPPLLGAATLIFASQRRINATAAGHRAQRAHLRSAALLPAAVYGGYFGAGLGVMLLAVLAVTGREEIRAANAFKNLLSAGVSLATISIFTLQGVVRWPETLVMLGGAILGGVIGGRLNAVLPPALVRAVVIAIGGAMTLVYGYRYWL